VKLKRMEGVSLPVPTEIRFQIFHALSIL